jgi:hypothetical protein
MKVVIIVILALFVTINAQYTPAQIYSMLGKGFDVAWSQYRPIQKKYTSALPKMINESGFSNVRIRIN